MRKLFIALLLTMPLCAPVVAGAHAKPLEIGDTFTLQSKVLDEQRRINVFMPTYFGQPVEQPLPVLYMPDGGMNEDFLHIAGLVQVSVSNGTMRPFLLVGIENTERRRDLTGPTKDPEDLKIAPRVGGSAAFRKFLREELFPAIERRYPVTQERAIVGESLAGFFVVETYMLEPGLFDAYIAADPSLWWNFGAVVREAPGKVDAASLQSKQLFIATSGHEGILEPVEKFVAVLRAKGVRNMHYLPMPAELHSTIYHPAAMAAFRKLFAPPAEPNVH